MPPKKKITKGPTAVEATIHHDKRANLPPAEAEEDLSGVDATTQLRYPRDPSLDPQLVWRGKDTQDGDDLIVEAPPIYIQEKIDPRVLIENLRDTAGHGEQEPELSLFETFDGLDDREIVDFYQHEANWSNRMILGDSLQVMTSLAEREALRGKVQMIYIDPPYGIKFGSNWQVSARNRDVADGKIENVTREAEMVKAFRDTWELGIHSYLSYLRDRLVVARDLLTESGSVFVQMSDQNEHLVRSLLDEVFGSENFIALIPFRKKTMPLGASLLEQMSDFLLWYGKSKNRTFYRQLFTRQKTELDTHWQWVQMPDRSVRKMTRDEMSDPRRVPSGGRIFQLVSLNPPTYNAASAFRFDFLGTAFVPPQGQCWITNATGMQRLALADRLQIQGDRLVYRLFFDDGGLQKLTAPWNDTIGPRDKVYVVQTATEVVKRCMAMTTTPGDLVLDPTSGSGTTALVAETWGRRWITIDASRIAMTVARARLMAARLPPYILADSLLGFEIEAKLSGVPNLKPSNTGNDIRRDFVYERVVRTSSSSIARNDEIDGALTWEDREAAIRRRAEPQFLFDSPIEDGRKVRVSGPFTVESLAPHRSLAFAVSGVPSEGAADHNSASGDFEQSIIDNLRAAGIQNGKKAERLSFDSIEAYAGIFIQAVGIREDAGEGQAKRIGIALGPQYGTVSPAFVRDAAREAGKAKDIDLLCILGFAFDPLAVGAAGDGYISGDEGFDVAAERKLGRMPVLMVRMNTDLHMGEVLKKTGAGNLFTVFGEPDIDLRTEDGKLIVALKGIDVYDPTTGEVRSNDTDQIALWMIDTNYNGESFFVRHCYFTGGQDPYKRLKTALKADIDPDAWASLYQTESRPFALPETGNIAVKVINDYGDEVMKVFDTKGY